MRQTRIGLDIGATGVRAAELNMRSIPPALTRIAQVPVPEGAVVAGEVKDVSAVAGAVKDLWKHGKFHGREVTLGVANQRVVVREVTVPWLADRKELRASLPFQVQEFVPIPLDDAVLDFYTLEELEKDGKKMVRLLLVAAQKQMIRSMVDAVEHAHLRPVGLDLVPFALVRSLGTIADGEVTSEVGDEALVDIGAEVTSVCIHAWGVPRFVRILASGGQQVTAAVASSMGVEAAEAERFKRGSLAPEEDHLARTASALAASSVQSLVDDVQSSLEFYMSKMAGARISRVALSGGGSRLEGLAEMLRERVPSTTVEEGHAFGRVHADLDMAPDALAEAEPLMAVAVGLALPGVQG
jgi:type IV pilus assembly protein PilM